MLKYSTRPQNSVHSNAGSADCFLVGISGDAAARADGDIDMTQAAEISLAQIRSALATNPSVDCIVTPLMADTFDATDLAAELARARYSGTYKILAPDLPRPDLVTREISQLCPLARVVVLGRPLHS